MKLMRLSRLLAIAALVLGFAAGCGPKKKTPVTELKRKEAAHLASEADFAFTLRDYARAEGLLTKAVAACPDAGAYWISLGTVRVRLGNRGGAKEAYKGALAAYESAAEEDKKQVEPRLQQVYVLALLGRTDDARATAAKAAKQFPENRDVRVFLESKQLDQWLADPKFKEIAL